MPAQPVFPPRRWTMAVAGIAPLPLLVIGIGILVVTLATDTPELALAIPAGLAVLIVCGRFPEVAILVVLVVSATIGSIVAFTELTPEDVPWIIDGALLGLWLAVAGMYLSGRGKRSPWLWPGLLASALYLGFTAVRIPLADPVSLGFDSFRASGWHMLALVLVAVGPWSTKTHLRMARVVALVALGVGAYAGFRLATGYADAEATLWETSPGPPRFGGSFLSGFQLASWTATLIPFCLALALMWRGIWRLVGAAAIVVLAVALIASHTRAGLLAAGIGIAVVLGLFLLSRASRGRSATALAVGMLIAAIGIGGLAVVTAGSGRQGERYARLLTPGEDPALADRTQAWGDALDTMYWEPWGYGLGTVGSVARLENPLEVVGPPYLDSSYLKVGLEQGWVAMLLFVLALILLLLGLAKRAIVISDPQRSLLAVGACGTLTALMALFLLGLYIEGPQTVTAWILVGLGAAQVRPGLRRDSPSAG